PPTHPLTPTPSNRPASLLSAQTPPPPPTPPLPSPSPASEVYKRHPPEPPAPPQPPETAPPGKPVAAAEPPAGKQPSAEPPPAPPSPKPPVAPMPMGAPPTPAPQRPEAPRRPAPPPPAATWRSPSPPAAPQPSRSATEPFAAAPNPPQPPTAPTRSVATETSPHNVRPGEHQQPTPPPAQPPSDAPRHSRRARKGHRYRPEPDDDEAPSAPGAAVPQRLPTDQTQPAPRVGPTTAFAWLPPSHSDSDRPSEAEAAPPPTETHPEPTGGRRARRRADQAATATPTTALPPSSGLAPTRAQPPGPVRAQPPHSPAQGQFPPAPAPARPHSEPAAVDGGRAGKPAKLVSKRGWRRWVHSVTRINFGLSPDEKYELDLRNRVSTRPRGSYQIAVLGLKGGAGKTTTTVTLGTTLAQVRGDRILVLDADPGCGNLAERAGRSSPSSIADLLADPQLSHYNDVRAHTSVNAANLEILPTQEYTTARRGLSGEDMRIAVDKVSKFYNLVIADCGAGLFDPVTRGVLETSSAIVIVTNVSIDSARQTAIALEWLRHNGYQDLLNRACVVVDHVSVGETNVAEKHVVRQFQQQLQPGRVVVLPWDKHIAAGGEIHLEQLGPVYKRRILELAAALSDDFERAGRR
ncbi:MinD/ParA family ATP-binding protein, partial [Mycobacterium persicum]|uniref:MinD/ParA family ATP-binding protein n=1 Tax=Mycobacterium persicum TaxID=1487726 RepID=UPI001593104A